MSESAARPAGPHRSCSLLKCHLFLSNDLHNAKLLTRKIQIKRGRESFWNQGAISRERGGRPGGPLLTPSLPAVVCPAWTGTLWPPASAPDCQESRGHLGTPWPSHSLHSPRSLCLWGDACTCLGKEGWRGVRAGVCSGESLWLWWPPPFVLRHFKGVPGAWGGAKPTLLSGALVCGLSRAGVGSCCRRGGGLTWHFLSLSQGVGAQSQGLGWLPGEMPARRNARSSL